MPKRKYDCLRRPFDPTARRYQVGKREVFPKKVDLRPNCPPVYDQGNLGACTGNAWAFMVHWLLRQLKQGDWIPSRLFIYYHERVLEHDVAQDNGATVADGAATLDTKGVCKESTWPYNIAKFSVCPSVNAFREAIQYLVPGALHVNNENIDEIKSALKSKYPVILGFTVYESFESDDVTKTGLVPLPKVNEGILGGHCVAIVGYDDDFAFPHDWNAPKGGFIVRNSWGSSWGLKGYFIVPYSYFTNPDLASDFWVAKRLI